MNNYYQGVFLILLSALGFAFMPTFAKFAYPKDVSVMTLLFLRFSLAAVIFFCYLAFKRQSIRLDKRNLLGLFLLGAIGYTLQSTFYFSSLKYIPASLVILIVYTHPTIIAVISCALDREPLTKNITLSLIFSFIGLALMLGTTLGKINTLGLLLAAGASMVYAGYVIFSNKILKQVPPIIATAFICLFTSMGLFVAGLSSKSLSFGFSGTAWPWIIGLVIVSTVCAMLTFFQGLEILGPTKATVLSTAEPVFGVIIAMILFSDRLTTIQFLGAFGVIVGAVIAVYARDNTNFKEQQDLTKSS